MRINKFYIASLLSIIVSTTLYAQESDSSVVNNDYDPLIREDRIWEYENQHYMGWWHTLTRMKFNGTEELDGKIYHRLETIYRRFISEDVETDSEGNTILFVDIDKITEDPNEFPVYLLREENGIVYGRYKKDNSEFKWIDISLFGQQCAELEFNENEFVLYDFTKGKGESYESVIHFGNGVASSFFLVTDSYQISNNGKDWICQENEYVEDFWPIKFVEGVGPIEGGTLGYNFAKAYVSMSTMPEILNNVYDLDGNIVYQGLNSDYIDRATGIKHISTDKSPQITYSPTSNQILVNITTTLDIFDTSGRQVLQRTVQAGDRVDVSELPAGIYIATLSNGSAVKICLN